MDFAFLPPEVNSGRMYSGPGSGPMLAAAGNWDALAAELEVAAATCASVLSSLTSVHWFGPAAAAMTATATPYLDWLHSTAERTRQTGMQARAAAAAYELAHAMTVPPAAVTANRIQLISLIATNFFGQNTAAIAATEAQYAEYWAQDAAAMCGYAASSAAAAQLTPFTYPDRPAGLTTRSAAVAQADTGAAAAGSSAQAVAAADPSLAALYTALDPSSLFYLDLSALDAIRVVGTAINGTFKMEGTVSGIIGAEDTLGVLPKGGAAPTAELAPVLTMPPGSSGGAGLGNVTATLARGGTIGSMSVPTGLATPSGGSSTAALAAVSEGGAPGIAATGEPAGSGPGMPGIPGMPGGTVSRPTVVIPRYGRRIIAVMAHPPAAG